VSCVFVSCARVDVNFFIGSLLGVCWEFVHGVFKVCLESVWSMFGVCWEYVGRVLDVCCNCIACVLYVRQKLERPFGYACVAWVDMHVCVGCVLDVCRMCESMPVRSFVYACVVWVDMQARIGSVLLCDGCVFVVRETHARPFGYATCLQP